MPFGEAPPTDPQRWRGIGPESPPVTPTGDQEPPKSKPSFVDVWSATFDRENQVFSAYAREANGSLQPRDDTLKPWDEIKGTKYEPHWTSFLSVQNRVELEERKRDIDRQEEAQKTINAAPWYMWLPASLAANITDPSILIPGGAFVRGAKGGIAISKQGLRTGTAAGIGITEQEFALQATQDLRTLPESALNIGAGALLGGLIGVGGGALLSRAEWRRVTAEIDRRWPIQQRW